jgi:hypothetical protein
MWGMRVTAAHGGYRTNLHNDDHIDVDDSFHIHDDHDSFHVDNFDTDTW